MKIVLFIYRCLQQYLYHFSITVIQLSFSSQYFLDIVELVEGFHRRKIVYICMQYLVAYLTQHRVVELEET